MFEVDINCSLLQQTVSRPLHSAQGQLGLIASDFESKQQLIGILITSPLTKSLDDPSLLHDRIEVKVTIYFNIDNALAVIAGLLVVLALLVSARSRHVESDVLPKYQSKQ